MGNFNIEIKAVGGHGCQRDVKSGGILYGCGSDTCPDCIIARAVSDLLRAGVLVESAKIVHWPGQPTEVVDEFVTGAPPSGLRPARKRTGSF